MNTRTATSPPSATVTPELPLSRLNLMRVVLDGPRRPRDQPRPRWRGAAGGLLHPRSQPLPLVRRQQRVPLPLRPTFAIDLAPFPVDRERSIDEMENSTLPQANQAGLLDLESPAARYNL